MAEVKALEADGPKDSIHIEKLALENSTDVNGETFEPPTAAEEAAVIRKLDYRLLPLVFVLYSLSVLDRSNLGNAKLAGMAKDIDLSNYNYNWLGTCFYIAYILFQWTIIGWKQFKPHRWAAVVVFFWGFIATIQATVHSWAGLMTCRFFLGIAEAMFGPGVPLYLSYFYPRDKIGFRHGVFISGAAMANAYGSALAYGISQIRGSVAPWRVLFVIEGVPTCLIAIIVWFYLPDSIDGARFLNAREKAVADHYVARNQKVDVHRKAGVKFKELFQAFKEPQSYIPGIMYFSCNVSFASLPLFVPTIISQIGVFSQIQSNGLSAPPYLLNFFTIILLAWLSDRYRMRGPFCGLAALVAAVGFLVQATTTSVVGTNVFPDDEKPYFRKGMWISFSFCFLVFVLSAVLSSWLMKENRRMDREEGAIRDREHDIVDAPRTSDSLAEGKFRYII